MDDAAFESDLPHDKPAVATQLAYAFVSGSFLMNGFVQAFENEFHISVDRPPVMNLLTPRSVPTTGALAAQYTVCDRWFACLPTSTAPNRLMSMCGDTNIDETGTLLPDQTTVYDWLLTHGVRWRVYAAGRPGETYSSTVVGRAGTMASVSAVLSATAANTATASVTSPSLSGSGGALPLQEGNANIRAAFSGAVQNLVTQHQAEALAKLSRAGQLLGWLTPLGPTRYEQLAWWPRPPATRRRLAPA